MSAAIERLMVLVENEERRADETNERMRQRWESESPRDRLRDHPPRVMAGLSTRDIRAALNGDQAVLDDYWRREEHMEALRKRREP